MPLRDGVPVRTDLGTSAGVPRFIHPAQFLPAEEFDAVGRRRGESHPGPPHGLPRARSSSPGATTSEYSYDAYIRGRFNGAFTRAALDALPEHATTYQAWHKSTVALLDTDQYPQHPRLFSARWQRYLTF